MIDNFSNLPSVVTEQVDGNIRFSPTPRGPIVLVLGSASKGTSAGYYVSRVGDAFSTFGKTGTLTRGLEEVAGFGAENVFLKRIGAKSATLYNVGGIGNYIQTALKDDSAGEDYEIVYLCPSQIAGGVTTGRLRVRNSSGTVVYDNYAGLATVLDNGEVYVSGTFTEDLDEETYISTDDEDWISMADLAGDIINVAGQAFAEGDGATTEFPLPWSLIDPFSVKIYVDESDGTDYAEAAYKDFDYGGNSLLSEYGVLLEKDIAPSVSFPVAGKYGLMLHQIEVLGGTLSTGITLKFTDQNGDDIDGTGNSYDTISVDAASTPAQVAAAINGHSVIEHKLFAKVSSNYVNIFDIQNPTTQDSGLFYIECTSGAAAIVLKSQNPEDVAAGVASNISFVNSSLQITKTDGWGTGVEEEMLLEIWGDEDDNVGSTYITAVIGGGTIIEVTEQDFIFGCVDESAGANVRYRISNRMMPIVKFGTALPAATGSTAITLDGFGFVSAHDGIDTTNSVLFVPGTANSDELLAGLDGASLEMCPHASTLRHQVGLDGGLLEASGYTLATTEEPTVTNVQDLILAYYPIDYTCGTGLNTGKYGTEGNGNSGAITLAIASGAALTITNGGWNENISIALQTTSSIWTGVPTTSYADGEITMTLNAPSTADLSDPINWLAAGEEVYLYVDTTDVAEAGWYEVIDLNDTTDVLTLVGTANFTGNGANITSLFFADNDANTPALINTALIAADSSYRFLNDAGGVSTSTIPITEAVSFATLASGVDATWTFTDATSAGSAVYDKGYWETTVGWSIVWTGGSVNEFALSGCITGGTLISAAMLSVGDIIQFVDLTDSPAFIVESAVASGSDLRVIVRDSTQDISALLPAISQGAIVGNVVLGGSGDGIVIRKDNSYEIPESVLSYDDVDITTDVVYWTQDATDPKSTAVSIDGDESNLDVVDELENSITIDAITYASLSDEQAVEQIAIVEADEAFATYSYDSNTVYYLDEGTDGTSMSKMETFEALQRAYRDLEATDVDIVYPVGTYLDDMNIADGDTVTINHQDNRVVGRHYPAAGSTGDVLGYVYVEEVNGELEFWWDTDGDGDAEIWPVGYTGITTPTRDSTDPLVAADFHEVNFAYQLGDFCFSLSVNDNEAFGVIGTKGPTNYGAAAISNWVGQAPTYNSAGEVVVNGSGLLGNKFMAGAIGHDYGFFATSSGYLPTSGSFEADSDVLTDSNGEMIDIGKYLRIVAGQGRYLNSFDTTGFGYADPAAGALAGLFSTLAADEAITNKSLVGLSMPYNINKAKLNSLVGARYIMLKPVNGVATVVDGPTATRATSDYNRDTTCRIVSEALNRVRTVAQPFIGKGASTLRITSLEHAVNEALNAMKASGSLIEKYVSVYQTSEMRAQGLVDIDMTLVVAYEIRKIRVKVGLALL